MSTVCLAGSGQTLHSIHPTLALIFQGCQLQLFRVEQIEKKWTLGDVTGVLFRSKQQQQQLNDL
jgi:hypothetical protein